MWGTALGLGWFDVGERRSGNYTPRGLCGRWAPSCAGELRELEVTWTFGAPGRLRPRGGVLENSDETRACDP